MAEYEFPDDLLEAQRDFYAANRRVMELAEALPTTAAVLAGKAKRPTGEQREELGGGPR